MKRMLLALLAAAAVLVLPSSARPTTCRAGAVVARIDGHATCLTEGLRCSPHYEQRFRSYRLTCADRHLKARWSALYRPLRVPSLAPGNACPTTAADSRTLGEIVDWKSRAPAWGAGPAYPLLDDKNGAAVLTFDYPPPEGFGTEWGVAKFPWFADRTYHGRILIRGRQLDGPNEIRFEDGWPGFTAEKDLHPAAELRLDDDASAGHPSTTRLRAAGCYAYQVDGWRLSRLIVFEAVAKPARQ